ncbi:MAG: hypothetical protein R3330_04775 [Saprospiraceae bacterium]|nr:hypothetical protein [Saprospiraceae bacterium]
MDESTADTHELVAAVAGRKIKVTAVHLGAASAQTVKFQSGTTDLTGVFAMAANGNLDIEGTSLVTAAGEALNMVLSQAVQTGGWIEYELI